MDGNLFWGKGISLLLGVPLGSIQSQLTLTFHSFLIVGLQNAQVRDVFGSLELKPKVLAGCFCSWPRVGRELQVGWAGSRHSSALPFVFLDVTPVYKDLVLHVSSTL